MSALRAANADLASGKTIINAASGDVQSGKQITNSPRERIAEIKANLYTLYLQDSATYPQYEGFANDGVNIVRATFNNY